MIKLRHGNLFRGKLPPKPHLRTLKLSKYLNKLPLSPASIDWGSKVADWLMLGNGPDPTVTYPNFQGAGDCTCAAAGHAIIEWLTQNDLPITITATDVLAAYSAITGYDPTQTDAQGNNPTDNGAAMTDVLAYWQKVGIGGHKIAAWLQVDHNNLAEVCHAIYSFGGAYTGVNLPDDAMDEFNQPLPAWADVSEPADPDEGHAIWTPGYDPMDQDEVTWGQEIPASLPWAAKYVDEQYVVLGLDWLAPNGMSPSNLNMGQLQADIAAQLA